MWEACQRAPFLAEYLHRLPMGEVGAPVYTPKLSRGMETHNVIYPIKEGLFVHIFPDQEGERDIYIPIEPTVMLDLDPVSAEVEKTLVQWAEEIGRLEDEEEKKKLLISLVEMVCLTKPPAPGTNGKVKHVLVTPRELAGIKYRVLRDKIGLGVLQPLLLDPYLEDISCSGVGPIFIEHKIFKSVQAAIHFTTLEEVDKFVVWLGEWIKSPVTVRNPLVDAVLPDGSRINIVYGQEISKRGSNFTIRRFSDNPTSVLELIGFGTLDYLMAAYLSLMLEEGMNLFVVGATASGKTTTLNAINTFILPDAKIVTIEDTPEVYVPHKNWLQEVTRMTTRDNRGGEVGMFDLLKAALRQRPDRIIVGEIRGEEGRIAFQAMQTGHGVMSTFHAASVEKLLQRLTGDPIKIPKTYIDNLNLVVIQSAVRLEGKGMARRVLSINEIIGYEPETQSFSYLEAFRWDPSTDTFLFPGYMNSYLLEQRIAAKRGIPPSKRKEIYLELQKREKIFERLHKEKGISGFDEFFRILTEARRQKLL
jgi:flagellar protein FlaI